MKRWEEFLPVRFIRYSVYVTTRFPNWLDVTIFHRDDFAIIGFLKFIGKLFTFRVNWKKYIYIYRKILWYFVNHHVKVYKIFGEFFSRKILLESKRMKSKPRIQKYYIFSENYILSKSIKCLKFKFNIFPIFSWFEILERILLRIFLSKSIFSENYILSKSIKFEI